jgi:two-component system chemotaxis response regulator CheB
MPKAKPAKHHLTEFTCPDCVGVLSVERENNGHRDYSCQVGHRFSTRSLLFAKEKEVERVLWAAVALLEHVMHVYDRMERETKPNAKDRRRLEQRINEAKKQKQSLISMIEHTHAWD